MENKIKKCVIEKKRGNKVYGALYYISQTDTKRLDIYEEYPKEYTKMFFKFNKQKIMTYIMPKKTENAPPTKRYLDLIKQGYKDCKLNLKSLNDALLQLKHLRVR